MRGSAPEECDKYDDIDADQLDETERGDLSEDRARGDVGLGGLGLSGCGVRRGVRVCGQGPDRRMGIEIEDRELRSAGHRTGAQLGHERGRDQRMSTEIVEQVCLDRELVDGHAQRLGVRLAELAFCLRRGRRISTAPANQAAARGLGQRVAVSLAAGQHRDGRNDLEIVRDHVGRQLSPQRGVEARPQRFDRGTPVGQQETGGELVADVGILA